MSTSASEIQRYEDHVVIKSHELIAANFCDMTLKEQQLLTLAISLIPENQDSSDIIRVNIERKVFDIVFGANGMSSVKLKGLAKLLQTRAVELAPRGGTNLDLFDDDSPEEENWRRVVLVPTCEYRNGVFTLTFNHDLNEHFLELKNRVTSYQLSNVIDLKSAYHYRLYEILVTYLDLSRRLFAIPLDRLRGMIGVGDKYPDFRNFRRRVLDPAVQTCSEVTNLMVNYEVVAGRNGRVEEIEFNVQRREDLLDLLPPATIDAPDIKSRLAARLMEMEPEIMEITARKIADLHTGEEADFVGHVQAGRAYIDLLVGRGTSVNQDGIIYKAVKEKWQPKQRRSTPKKEDKSTLKMQLEPQQKTPVDLVAVRKSIEQEPDLLASFKNFLQRRRDPVSLDLLDRDGLEAFGLENQLEDFWALLQNQRKMQKQE
jgi:hypothetical protein